MTSVKRVIVVMLVLVVMACGKGTTKGEGTATGSGTGTGTGTNRDAAVVAPDAVTVSDACTSPDDCAIGCFSDASDCCGDACGCEHPFTKERLKAVTAEREALCSRKDYDCPQVRCMARRFWPGCENGRCTAVSVPPAAECMKDEDCTTSTAVEGRCCGACDESVWVKKDLDAYHAWAKTQCAAVQCLQRTCPVGTPVKARCNAGACVIARP